MTRFLRSLFTRQARPQTRTRLGLTALEGREVPAVLFWTYTGNDFGNTSTPGNWNPAQAPVNNDILVFNSLGRNAVFPNSGTYQVEIFNDWAGNTIKAPEGITLQNGFMRGGTIQSDKELKITGTFTAENKTVITDDIKVVTPATFDSITSAATAKVTVAGTLVIPYDQNASNGAKLVNKLPMMVNAGGEVRLDEGGDLDTSENISVTGTVRLWGVTADPAKITKNGTGDPTLTGGGTIDFYGGGGVCELFTSFSGHIKTTGGTTVDFTGSKLDNTHNRNFGLKLTGAGGVFTSGTSATITVSAGMLLDGGAKFVTSSGGTYGVNVTVNGDMWFYNGGKLDMSSQALGLNTLKTLGNVRAESKLNETSFTFGWNYATGAIDKWTIGSATQSFTLDLVNNPKVFFVRGGVNPNPVAGYFLDVYGTVNGSFSFFSFIMSAGNSPKKFYKNP